MIKKFQIFCKINIDLTKNRHFGEIFFSPVQLPVWSFLFDNNSKSIAFQILFVAINALTHVSAMEHLLISILISTVA